MLEARHIGPHRDPERATVGSKLKKLVRFPPIHRGVIAPCSNGRCRGHRAGTTVGIPIGPPPERGGKILSPTPHQYLRRRTRGLEGGCA